MTHILLYLLFLPKCTVCNLIEMSDVTLYVCHLLITNAFGFTFILFGVMKSLFLLSACENMTIMYHLYSFTSDVQL